MNTWLFLIVAIVGLAGPDEAGASRARRLDQLEAIYQANMESLPRAGLIRYEVEYALTTERKAAGKRRGHTIHGTFAFDGPSCYWQQSSALGTLSGESQGLLDDVAWYANVGRAVTDGHYSLEEVRVFPDKVTPTQGPLTAYVGNDRFFSHLGLDLAPGRPPERLSDLYSDGRIFPGGDRQRSSVEITEGVKLDGRRVVRVALGGTGGQQVLWIDTERGGIPLRIRNEIRPALADDRRDVPGRARDPANGPPERAAVSIVQFDFQDLRELSRGVWLPFCQVHSTTDASGGRGEIEPWKTVRIVDASFDTPPAPATLRIEFPDPVTLQAGSSDFPVAVLNRTPRRVWDREALAALAEEIEHSAREESTPDTVLGFLTSERLVLAAIAIAMFVYAAMVCRRWYRERPEGGRAPQAVIPPDSPD